jgi:hypothetical protein
MHPWSEYQAEFRIIRLLHTFVAKRRSSDRRERRLRRYRRRQEGTSERYRTRQEGEDIWEGRRSRTSSSIAIRSRTQWVSRLRMQTILQPCLSHLNPLLETRTLSDTFLTHSPSRCRRSLVGFFADLDHKDGNFGCHSDTKKMIYGAARTCRSSTPYTYNIVEMSEWGWDRYCIVLLAWGDHYCLTIPFSKMTVSYHSVLKNGKWKEN